jgi:parvulin-like peptidyl-prolyl isomerase
LIVSFLLALPACTEPPKPEKADTKNIEGREGEVELSSLPAGPIAIVNKVEIPNEMFAEVYDLKLKKYADRGREIPKTADRRYRKSISERLIYHEVLRQEAAAMGIDYDPADLTAREEQQHKGIKNWEEHLERRGETERSLRELFIAELREKAILEKKGELTVTPEEVAEDYEKIKGNWESDKPRARASHILIPIDPDAARVAPGAKPEEKDPAEAKKLEDAAQAIADEIYALATAPDADFEELARTRSVGPSAPKGGDIGIFTPDRMTEEFSAVAFELEPGQISKPVKTKFGFHVIKLYGKWGPGPLPQDALQDQIEERLRQRKLHAGRRDLKKSLLDKYDIVDNIAPTLGPEPKRNAGRRGGMRDGKAGGQRAGKLRDDIKAAHQQQIKPPTREAGSAAPEGKAAAPEGKAAAPEGKAAAPEGKAATPDAKAGDGSPPLVPDRPEP